MFSSCNEVCQYLSFLILPYLPFQKMKLWKLDVTGY